MGKRRRTRYYVVFEGRNPGVYTNYELSRAQTDSIREAAPRFDSPDAAYEYWLKLDPVKRETTILEVVRKSCGCCWYCGTPLTTQLDHKGKGQFDHQEPRFQQGGDGFENLVLACHTCNVNEKSGRNVEEYRTWLLEHRPHSYIERTVVFFGEHSRQERHALSVSRDTAWKCPNSTALPCAN